MGTRLHYSDMRAGTEGGCSSRNAKLLSGGNVRSLPHMRTCASEAAMQRLQGFMHYFERRGLQSSPNGVT
jgi:hypothetical protein